MWQCRADSGWRLDLVRSATTESARGALPTPAHESGRVARLAGSAARAQLRADLTTGCTVVTMSRLSRASEPSSDDRRQILATALPGTDDRPADASAISEVGRDGVSLLSPEELAWLLELSSELNDLDDLDAVLARIASASCELLKTEMSTVHLLQDDESRLEVVAAEGLDAVLAGRSSTPVGENLASLVAQSGKPVRCCEEPADGEAQLPVVSDVGIHAAMLVPLERRGEVIGVLGVETRAQRSFSTGEERLLQALANQAAGAIERAKLYETQQRNVVMGRGRDAHERLTQAVLEGLGVDALTQLAAEFVQTPLALLNQFGCLLHAVTPDGEDASGLWEEHVADRRFDRQLERMREFTLDRRQMDERRLIREAGFDGRIAPAVAAEEVLGFVVTLELGSLGDPEAIVLKQAARIVAAELLRERSIADAEARVHGDLLRSLLLGQGDGVELTERAALLGHDLATTQCVLMIRAGDVPSPLAPGVAVSAAGWASTKIGLRGMLAGVEGGTAALLSASDRDLSRETIEGWVDALRERLASLGVDLPLYVGASPLAAAEALHDSFKSAKAALAVRSLDGAAGVTHFEDVELLAMLVSVVHRDVLRRFVRSCIGELQAYDARRGGALAHTLEVYLDSSGVARHAAEALSIHPHSLRYRLRRISEIQGLDRRDPMARLMAHLALKLRGVV